VELANLHSVPEVLVLLQGHCLCVQGFQKYHFLQGEEILGSVEMYYRKTLPNLEIYHEFLSQYEKIVGLLCYPHFRRNSDRSLHSLIAILLWCEVIIDVIPELDLLVSVTDSVVSERKREKV
jgi:hypothetical protein